MFKGEEFETHNIKLIHQTQDKKILTIVLGKLEPANMEEQSFNSKQATITTQCNDYNNKILSQMYLESCLAGCVTLYCFAKPTLVPSPVKFSLLKQMRTQQYNLSTRPGIM